MEKIKVKLTASEDHRTVSYKLSDLGISEKEWKTMAIEEKQTLLRQAIDGEEQPYWQFESFDE